MVILETIYLCLTINKQEIKIVMMMMFQFKLIMKMREVLVVVIIKGEINILVVAQCFYFKVLLEASLNLWSLIWDTDQIERRECIQVMQSLINL
jgi:hypothetical protein